MTSNMTGYLSADEEMSGEMTPGGSISITNYDDTEIRELIENKVDKEEGKGLSTNDYSDEDKNKLNNLPVNPLIEETDPNVPDWAKQLTKPSYTFDEIENKPDTYTPSSHTHTANDITDLGNIPTKTSDLENDSGYITGDYVDEAISSAITVAIGGEY